MQKLKKVLIEKGIVFDADEYQIMKGPEYDQCRKLVAIENGIIITVWYSAVLDPEFQLFDVKTFERIGVQNRYPDYDSWNYTDYSDRWNSWADVEESDSEFLAGMTWDDIYGI